MSDNEIKKKLVREFLIKDGSAVNTYRTLIIFGRNSSTYKFALCNAIMKIKPTGELRYQDLRDTFLTDFVNSYKDNPSQFQSGPNKFTMAIDEYLTTEMTVNDWDKLVFVAEKNIYNDVFDAFQKVGNGSINKDFLLFEHDKKNKKLIFTDNTLKVTENQYQCDLITAENEARRLIVSEAWRAGISANILEYDKQENIFYSRNKVRRVGLRSAVDVLIPYQRGRCFYCNRTLRRDVDHQNEAFPDVDHLLPHSFLTRQMTNLNPDGVWNLVIACKNCNRGPSGKSYSAPAAHYYIKLKQRNLLFTEEHKHSLRNSILISLNATTAAGVAYQMDEIYKIFEAFPGWTPSFYYPD